MEIYLTQTGSTLGTIAKAHGQAVENLARINQLSDPSRLVEGLSLLLPSGKEPPPHSAQLCASISPKADRALIEELLPALSWLCIQCAGFTPDGQLIMPRDSALLSETLAQSVIPLLSLSNLAVQGFSPQLAHGIFTDSAAAARMTEELLHELAQRGYGGVALSLQYLYDFDAEAYADFSARLAHRLHHEGFYLFCCLPPKPELFSAAEAADRLILLCHGYGGIDTPPSAIAPLPLVERALDSALEHFPARKLILSLSSYGCSWALPWRQGQQGRPLPCSLAVDMAVSGGSSISFDRSAQAPFFVFNTYGQRRVVYYEDCRSVNARLSAAFSRSLGGIDLYTRDRLYRPALELVKSRVLSEKLV